VKEWNYSPSRAIQQSVAENLQGFPRERDMTHTILRFLGNIFMRIFLKIYFRLKIVGKEHLPKSGNYVFIANHSSHLDALCILAAFPTKLIDWTFSVAAKDCFFSSFLRSFFSAVFVNALPFDRIDKKRESLEMCSAVLNVPKQVLIMFPEGTRSMTGEIQPFKQGIGILVAGTDRLVVPAYIKGAFEAWPKNSKIPWPKHVSVIIGEPMRFSHIPRTQEGFIKVAREMEAAVKRLRSQDDEC